MCRQERYRELERFACNPRHMPDSKQVCYTGVSCEEAEEDKRKQSTVQSAFYLVSRLAFVYLVYVCLAVADYERYR